MNRVAVIGDLHACYQELSELYSILEWQSLDEIWTVGDLVDRGPDNHLTVKFCREKGIKSVMGNHDDSIVNHFDKWVKTGLYPKNSDKKKTLEDLTPDDVEYLRTLPPLHVIDDLGLIIVHGGVWPKLPLYAQPLNVIRAQLIHPDQPGKCRWWGEDADIHFSGKTEEQSRAEGFDRWYKLYDYKYDCVYGHSTWAQPMVHQNPGMGRTIGVDTGSCFGGSVTAACISVDKPLHFISVKAKQVWCEDTRRSFWEAD